MPHKHVARKTLNLARHPGSLITEPLKKRYYDKYHGKRRFPQLIFALDLLIVGIGIGFAISAVVFFLFGRVTVADQIDFAASIAPTPVSSGSPSTLIISWMNTSDEEIRNATLDLSYPDHFLLDKIVYEDANQTDDKVIIGTVPIQGSGSLKVSGIMFGDVGGEQVFSSDLTFRFGKRNRKAVKHSKHVFSPEASALSIDATVPDTLISGQEIEGVIHLTNNGPVDFGEVSIVPKRSDFNFRATEGVSEKRENDQVIWTIPELASGASVDVEFLGTAPVTDEEGMHDWGFDATFTFGDTRYFQGETVKNFRLVPAPIELNQLIDTSVLTPGSNASLLATYKNISDETVQNFNLFVDTTSPFFAKRDGDHTFYNQKSEVWDIAHRSVPQSLTPDENGEIRVSVPLRSSIPQSSTNVYENLSGEIRIGATFFLPKMNVRGTVYSKPISLPITSPVNLRSFGRYSTPQGDQIGRGPIPPITGEETRYWVFWSVNGTTNTLENVEINGNLPPYARFTGKQSVTTGSEAVQEAGSVVWRVGTLHSTFGPGSKAVQIGFEIGVTPPTELAGQTITILDNNTFTARDAVTGEVVRGFGARVTTSLPDDPIAGGFGRATQ